MNLKQENTVFFSLNILCLNGCKKSSFMQISCVILSSLAGLRCFVEINDRMIFVERNYFMYNTISIQDAETGKKILTEVKRKKKKKSMRALIRLTAANQKYQLEVSYIPERICSYESLLTVSVVKSLPHELN